MPNYRQPLSYAGGAIGGGAGAGMGGMMGGLGQLLEPLSYPQQALYGAGRSLYRGLSGEGTWQDALGAVPGVLGGLGALGAAFVPGVGLPLAGAIGAGMAGLGQGFGKSTGNEAFNAPTPEDLAGGLGMDPENGVTNFLLSALTDPLSYVGGLGGRAAGAAGGARYGKRLENIAATMGPGYQDSALLDRLIAAGPQLPDRFANKLSSLADDPNFWRIASELPPGSTPYFGGAEAMTFINNPERDHLVRIAGGPAATDTLRGWEKGLAGAPPPRANEAQTLLPAARSIPIGDYRVEHLPAVNVMPHAAEWNAAELERLARMEKAGPVLERLTSDLGYVPQDIMVPDTAMKNAARLGLPGGEFRVHPGNLGETAAGNMLLIDPGTVLPKPGTVSPEMFTPTQGTRLENWLLKKIGAQESVQADIARGLDPAAYAGRGVTPEEVAQITRALEIEAHGTPISLLTTGQPLSQLPTGAVVGAAPPALGPSSFARQLQEVFQQMENRTPPRPFLSPSQPSLDFSAAPAVPVSQGGLGNSAELAAAIQRFLQSTAGGSTAVIPRPPPYFSLPGTSLPMSTAGRPRGPKPIFFSSR